MRSEYELDRQDASTKFYHGDTGRPRDTPGPLRRWAAVAALGVSLAVLPTVVEGHDQMVIGSSEGGGAVVVVRDAPDAVEPPMLRADLFGELMDSLYEILDILDGEDPANGDGGSGDDESDEEEGGGDETPGDGDGGDGGDDGGGGEGGDVPWYEELEDALDDAMSHYNTAGPENFADYHDTTEALMFDLYWYIDDEQSSGSPSISYEWQQTLLYTLDDLVDVLESGPE